MASQNNGQSHNEAAMPVSSIPITPPPAYSTLVHPSPSQSIDVIPTAPPLNAPPNPPPITHQPMSRFDFGDLMEIPIGVQACPPGLEYLVPLDQLLVQTYTDSSLKLESKTKFFVKTKTGRNIFWAIENTDCWTQCCFESSRPFEIKVFDIHNAQVIHFHRPLANVTNCVEISSPPGHVIGRIEQEYTFCYPQFLVKNHLNNTVLRIEGSATDSSCFHNDEFNILALDGTQIGKISKKWTGVSDMISGKGMFGVSFPLDLDVRMKAVMLGACTLMYVMYYEDD